MFNTTQLKSYALNFNKHHYLPVLYYFTPIIERTHLKELKKHNIKSTILAPGSSLYT